MMIEWRKIYFCLMISRLYLLVLKILIIRNKSEKKLFMKIILKSIKLYKGLSKINFVERIILLFTQSIKRVILKGILHNVYI